MRPERSYRLLFFIWYLLLLAGMVPGTVGWADDAVLTLERIFNAKEFDQQRFGPARWLRHQTGYTTLEPSTSGTDEGKDIVRYIPETGKQEVLVAAGRLVPEGKKSPLKIDDYHWSPDGLRLLIFTDTKRVWRQNTRGDYWILNLKTRKLWKLGGDAGPSTLMFAKFSPDGSRVAYVRKNNLFVQRLENGQITQLTADGSKTVINGTFDWVYEEEFDLRDGFRWSPDSKSIAYWQLDAEGVGNFSLINNTDGLYSKVIPVQYPKVGTTNSSARVGVVSSSGGKTRWFELPGDLRMHYIARMEWAANSEEVVFQRLNRLQNTNWVMLGNIHTGTVRTILTERDAAWLDVGDDLHWLDKGRRFTWVSERDGWRHVYVVSRSEKEIKLITPGNFDVISIEKV
ncbi:MAG: S9 family peptidase, partial [bacterium]|nr:S9 family peptidase [bacterium]